MFQNGSRALTRRRTLRRVLAMNDVEVKGVFLSSLASACLNLQVIAGSDAGGAVDPIGWYPAGRFRDLFELVDRRFASPDPIKERIGIEMMRLWYQHGGRAVAPTGVAFLRFQTGSEGYRSIVRGSSSATGEFTIEKLDETRGIAVVRSTTPFDRSMERGVLLGGMQAPGDLLYVDVVNREDVSTFHIRFR